MKIACVGDYSDEVIAHGAIDRALLLESVAQGIDLGVAWFETADLADPSILAGYDGIWVVPASPYASLENALGAIEYARVNGIAFLGTCGGYQHMLVEYARNVLGHAEAGISEVDPKCTMPIVSDLVCALREIEEPVTALAGSRLAELVGEAPMSETYNCGFGINPEFEHIFDGSVLRVAAVGEGSTVRAMELEGARFYLGTAFQPERYALRAERHPVVQAFVLAATGG